MKRMLATITALAFATACILPAAAMAKQPDQAARAAAARSASKGVSGQVAASAPAPVPGDAPKKETLTAVQVQQNPLVLIKKFTLDDLQAALADANAQTPPDTTSAQCYTALIAIAQSPISHPLPTSPGLFLALQKARDAQAFIANIQSPNGPLSQLNVACAPLVMNVNAVLLALGVQTGVVVGTGGLALPALPALPGLLSILPK